ncbi:hypothetical protein C8046_09630 [Serinibacter arcticus]|uniref:Uncharacterized protein n=1 Tax=Serinibacter arcticus TaxID=1655435 RepID=A0A2U1ZVA1_9MICO|nr:hypothetical protein [Serinibacter arcticus]PWD50873.1 hypothetical protein C8046_09630 [Serinibacter arcticus]
MILDSREPGYFWARHVYQDSALGDGLPGDVATVERANESLARYPRLTGEPLEELFPAVAHRMHPELSAAFTRPSMLAEPLRLTSTLAPVETPRLRGRVALAARTRGGEKPEKSFALASLRLLTEDGQPLAASRAAELRQRGSGTPRTPPSVSSATSPRGPRVTRSSTCWTFPTTSSSRASPCAPGCPTASRRRSR